MKNKRATKFLAILGFVVAIGAVGAMQYFNMGDRDKKAEAAADAVAVAATAALEWTQDRSERTVQVVTLVGQAPSVVTVRTLLTMRGAGRQSTVCASLPRIHDAVNVLLYDRIRGPISAGQRLDGVELAAFEGPLKDLLNRAYDEPTIETVRLVPGNAAMGDEGCTDKNARREANRDKGGQDKARKKVHDKGS